MAICTSQQEHLFGKLLTADTTTMTHHKNETSIKPTPQSIKQTSIYQTTKVQQLKDRLTTLTKTFSTGMHNMEIMDALYIK